MTYRVKRMVIATDAGPFFACSDLRPEREEQNPDTGQPHEDTPVMTERQKERKTAAAQPFLLTGILMQFVFRLA